MPITLNGSSGITINDGSAERITVGTSAGTTTNTVVDYTGIPSWAKRITLMISGVSTSGTSHLMLQIGDSGGIENTGYVGGAGLSAAGGVTGLSSSSAGYELEAGSTTAASIRYGSVVLTNLSGNLWVVSGIIGIPALSATVMCGGAKTLSDVLDRIRLTTVNGTDTFDAGAINIMWEG